MKATSLSDYAFLVRALGTNAILLTALTFSSGCRPPALAQDQAQTQPATEAKTQAHPQTAFKLPTEAAPADGPHASEINEFWEADKKQMPPTGAVLFIGSSSIRMWETLAQDFPEIPVINRGFGGSLIEESTRYAERIIFPYKPKIVVLCAGTNDLAYGGKNVQQVFQEFKDFEAKVHEALPDTRIVYISINPTFSRWNQEGDTLEVNHLIEKFIFENGTPTRKMNFINSHAQILTADGKPQAELLRDDKLHFNAEGYKVWTSIVHPRVLALATMDGVKKLPAQLARPDTP